jgi:hypothetical protein
MDFMDVLPTDVLAMLEHFRARQKPRRMRRRGPRYFALTVIARLDRAIQ